MDEKVYGRYISFTFKAELFRRDQPQLCRQMSLIKNIRRDKKQNQCPPSATSAAQNSPQQLTAPVQVTPTIPNFYGMHMHPVVMPMWQNTYWQNSPFPLTPTPTEREAGLSMIEAAASSTQDAYQMQQQQKVQQLKKKRGSKKSGSNKKSLENENQEKFQVNVQVNQSKNVHARPFEVNLQVNQSLSHMSPDTENGSGFRGLDITAEHHRRELNASSKSSMSQSKASTPRGGSERKEVNRRVYNRMLSEPVIPSARGFYQIADIPSYPTEPHLERPSAQIQIPRLLKSISHEQPSRRSYEGFFPKSTSSDDQGPFDRSFDGPAFLDSSAFEEVNDTYNFHEQKLNKVRGAEGRQDDMDNHSFSFTRGSDMSVSRARSQTDPTSDRKRIETVKASSIHCFQPIHEHQHSPQMISDSSCQQTHEMCHSLKSSVAASDLFDVGSSPYSIAKSTDVLGIPDEPKPQPNDLINVQYNKSIAITNAHLRHMKQRRHDATTLDKPVNEALHGGSLASDRSETEDMDLHSLASIASTGPNKDVFIDFLDKEAGTDMYGNKRSTK